MEDLLYGPQAIDRMMQKPEFSFLVKYYHLLYQSLIPNCSLTIKVLRQHLNISHSVELYILNGASRRLRCQRLVNFLLVRLDNVKDYAQFCNHLNLISVIAGLPDRLSTEFHTSGKWRGKVPHHLGLTPKENVAHQTSHDPKRTKFIKTIKDIKSIDYESCHSVNLIEDSVVVEDFTVQPIIDDDGALIYKADESSISDYYNMTSRRRLVVIARIQTAKQPSETGDVTTSSADTTMVVLEQERSLHMPISLELEFMLSSSEWSIVDTFFSPLCDCLPQDYQSTIAKLKSFPQFAGMEHQCQLNSLIPPALTDISVINEKILTFLVMNLCYNANSGGMTKLCDVMEQLIEFSESTSCIQEIRCAIGDGTADLPPPTTASSLSQSTDSVHQTCDADMAPLMPVTAVPAVSSYNDFNLKTEVVTAVGMSPTSGSETDTNVLGLQLLISKYQMILQSLPMDYENTLNLLQNYLTDDQICQILSSSNYSTANKIILDCLIEKFKESVNIPELCKKLELIASLSTSKQLSGIVNELKEVTSPKSTQEQPPSAEELKLPQVLTVDEDFTLLKAHYHTILHLMPGDYEQSIGKLQNHFSDDQICAILYSTNCRTANKLILDSLIERMSCKEDQLDLCDQLEKIATASDELKVIIQKLRSGVEFVPNTTDKEQPEVVAASYGIMYNMAFSDLRVDSSSKVVAVLKKNYDGLCNCLPKDSLVTIKRIKQHIPQLFVQGVERQLIELSSDTATNAMIIVLFIKHLNNETAVLSLCDILENLVDDGAPKKFIHTLRSEVIEALSDENATAEDNYFDHLIFSHMTNFSNPNVLAILKRHCPRLCNCLSEDYMKTLDRISLRATVPEGLVHQLTTLPFPKQVNHHIIAAMLRPLTNVAGVLGFCDIMENVLDDEQSRGLVEGIRNEICEVLSCPTAATTITTPPTTIAAAADASTTTATIATTVNIIKPITFIESLPVPPTAEHLTADHKSTGTETSANTNNETTQAGMSVSSTEVVSTDTLTE